MGIDRDVIQVRPDFGGGTTSKPIKIGNWTWGSIATAGTVDFASIDFRTVLAHQNDIDLGSPGTLITPKDSAGSAIGALTIGADDAQHLPVDLFNYFWLILVANASVTTDTQMLLTLKG